MTTGTCPDHGQYTSLAGFSCPTCRRIKDARSVLAHGNSCSAAHRAARELLEDLGARVGDGNPGYRDPGGESVSFDLGGSA